MMPEKTPVVTEKLPSLKLTYPLQMDGWNTTFLLGRPIFRGGLPLVSGRVAAAWKGAILTEQFTPQGFNQHSRRNVETPRVLRVLFWCWRNLTGGPAF